MTRWLALVALLGCEKADEAKPEKVEDETPVVPVPTDRVLQYRADRVPGYVVTLDMPNAPALELPLLNRLSYEIAFGPGTRERAVSLGKLAMGMEMSGQKLNVELDKDRLVLDMMGTTQQFKRGDAGSPFDIAETFDKPMAKATFTARTVELVPERSHPLMKGANGDNVFDAPLIMFPELPAGSIKPGHTWLVGRRTALGPGVGPIDVAYRFQYTGDDRCPASGGRCAVLRYTSGPKTDAVTAGGNQYPIVYELDGQAHFDLDRGAIDSGRLTVKLDITLNGKQVPAHGTYELKPVR